MENTTDLARQNGKSIIKPEADNQAQATRRMAAHY